jgi:molecular chaperone GrpE
MADQPRPGDGPGDESLDRPDTSDDALTVDDILAEGELAAESDPLTLAIAEREEYKALAQRIQAEFENYRKRSAQQQADEVVRATGKLVGELLPVLDAGEQALVHHPAETESLVNVLFGAIKKIGLEPMECEGGAFDPAEHEAVLHEPTDDPSAAPIVVQVMRTGYRWQGKVLRPAMVKVRG